MCFPMNFAKFFRITIYKTHREAATRGVLYENIFLKIHRKTTVSKSLFNKVAGKNAGLQERTVPRNECC